MGPGCAPPFYKAPLAIWHGLWLLASAGFSGFRLTRPDVRRAIARRRPDWSSPVVRMAATALVVVAAISINAAICGVLLVPWVGLLVEQLHGHAGQRSFHASWVGLDVLEAACLLSVAPLMRRKHQVRAEDANYSRVKNFYSA